MEHIATIKQRRVVDIQAATGDLDGHRVVQGNAGVDVLTVKTDTEWRGYTSYSLIFEKDGTAAEYAVDLIGGEASVLIPPDLMEATGKLRFSLKALDSENVVRLLTEERNAFLVVTESGPIDGGEGHEAELTVLEQAIADIGDLEQVADEARDAATRATEAAERAEQVADLDYAEATNKPSINEVTLIGDKTLQELGMTRASNRAVIDLF